MPKQLKKGRFPTLPAETQKLALEAEEAKREDKQEKLKVLKKALKKEMAICGAVQSGGSICMRKPISENGRCHMHGGNSKGQTTEEGKRKAMANLDPYNPLKHGLRMKNFENTLTKVEADYYNGVIEWYCEN